MGVSDSVQALGHTVSERAETAPAGLCVKGGSRVKGSMVTLDSQEVLGRRGQSVVWQHATRRAALKGARKTSPEKNQ